MATRKVGRGVVEEGKDPWGLDSGLPDDFDVTVKRSRFGYLSNYQDGEAPLLIWDYESPDVDSEYPIIWPLGTGWEVSRDGKTATHPKRSRFVDTSMMGRLIKRCTDLGKIGELRKRGTPTNATIWEGLSMHLVREPIVLPSGAVERGLPEKIVHLMPVEFLGGPATETEEVVVGASASPSALVARLTELATTLPLNRFQKAAMNIEELNATENRALLSEVLEDGETGFWAKAQS